MKLCLTITYPAIFERPVDCCRMALPKEPRFLLVDDEPALLRAVRRVVEAECPHWTLVCARHGAEALDRLKEGPFDAVMLDLHMPIMDGLTLLRQLKQNYPNIGRVVHSSHIEPTGYDTITELSDAILPKPADPQLILMTLQAALARSRKNAVECA